MAALKCPFEAAGPVAAGVRQDYVHTRGYDQSVSFSRTRSSLPFPHGSVR